MFIELYINGATKSSLTTKNEQDNTKNEFQYF